MIDYREGCTVPSRHHGYCWLVAFILAAFLARHDDFRGFPTSVSGVIDAEGYGHLWWLRKDVWVRKMEPKLRNVEELMSLTHTNVSASFA